MRSWSWPAPRAGPVLLVAVACGDATTSSTTNGVFVIETTVSAGGFWGTVLFGSLEILFALFLLYLVATRGVSALRRATDGQDRLKTAGLGVLVSLFAFGMLAFGIFLMTGMSMSKTVTFDEPDGTVVVVQEFLLRTSSTHVDLDRVVRVHYHYTPLTPGGDQPTPASGTITLILEDAAPLEVHSGRPDDTWNLALELGSHAGLSVSNS